ncbi:hypothetical protein L7F22_067466 [Adiantum nelumboides]|nr:hypothetical protein [Adiantum nelumboides]
MKEQLKYEDAHFQKLTASYNTVKNTLTALLQNQEPAAATPSTSDNAAANTLAALQEELQTEKLQRQLLVSGFMSQTAQHEAKVKQLELELAKAKADLEAVGSLASTSQIQAETHLPIQPPQMPEMPEFHSPEEEEQPRPAPGALDIREQMEQEIEDMPEGPAKEYLMYKRKVMESAALAFLQPEEQIKDFSSDFLQLPLMRHEANLWKEKMRPVVPRNEDGGYESIPLTTKEAKTLIEDHPSVAIKLKSLVAIQHGDIRSTERRSRSSSRPIARDQKRRRSRSPVLARRYAKRRRSRSPVPARSRISPQSCQGYRRAELTIREEFNQDYEDNREEDVAKQVEKIRQRRQEILEKYKQSQRVETVEKGASHLVTDFKPSLNDNSSTVFVHDFLQDVMPDRLEGLSESTPKSEIDFIFGESPAGGQNQVKRDGSVSRTSGLSDNWDDAEGYYCHRIGEVLDSRYEVVALHGRGVFSSVIRARPLRTSTNNAVDVAIKMIRNNDVMLKCGQQELKILKKLDGADPENKRHCVRLLTSLVYRNHLCLVFESMHMNLREALRKSVWKTGFSLGAMRHYAKQLFIALKHLRNCGVLHCDIKPDNMLVNEDKNVLKLCDFGSAMYTGENEITPYLVSRFYRAPEIMLGLVYDYPLDIWSVGCCLFEFFTGKVLFPGRTNNDMLKLHMELKGPFPKKMLKKARFVSEHFDQDYNFCSATDDPVTKSSIKHVWMNVKAKGIDSLLRGQGTMDDPKMLKDFKDLLDKSLILDPGKRLTVSEALRHPFISGK